MQTTGYLVGAFVKLTAGMEHGHNDLKCRLVQFLMFVNRNATAIVAHGDAVVLTNIHINAVAESCQSLVDGVVHDLTHQMVETLDMSVANVHGWTLPDCLQSFKDLDVGR